MKKIQTAFCLECGKKMPYTTEAWRESLDVRGTRFRCLTRAARCRCCRGFVYVRQIHDANVERKIGAYRRAKTRK